MFAPDHIKMVNTNSTVFGRKKRKKHHCMDNLYMDRQRGCDWGRMKGALMSIGIIIGCAGVAGILGWYFSTMGSQKLFHLETLSIDLESSRKLKLMINEDDVILTVSMQEYLPTQAHHIKCREPSDICLHWRKHATLKINRMQAQNAKCYNIQWRGNSCSETTLMDCFKLDDHWYAAGYDIERDGYDNHMEPYLNDGSREDMYAGSGFKERYWLSSRGVALLVDDTVPLFVGKAKSQNEFCFKAAHQKPYFPLNTSTPLLNYTLCHADNPTIMHRYIMDNYIKRPTNIPHRDLFSRPHWRYPATNEYSIDNDGNQTSLMEYVDSLRQYNFTDGWVDIDTGWQSTKLAYEFNQSSFPNPKMVIEYCSALDFKVSLATSPFIDVRSDTFTELEREQMLVTGCSGDLPALIKWKNKIGGLLDFSKIEAGKYLTRKMNRLESHLGISSFVFTNGGSNELPYCFNTATQLNHLNEYPQLYAQLAYTASKTQSNVISVGYGTSKYSLVTVMSDIEPSWKSHKGIKSIIPQVLKLNLMGYPFIMASGIHISDSGTLPTSVVDREFYIRWLQLITLLPCIQLSIPPWIYDQGVITIAQNMIKIHQKFVPTYQDLFKEFIHNGTPVIRPLWWSEPYNTIALRIDDQFLIGEDIMVAPIIEKGKTSRDIYFPPGLWRDKMTKRNIIGGKWIRNVTVALDHLPYFLKL
ncbi:unnamed protein product [Owenia fusiformis]|uniref:Uncharacterized protein n=1 Tax=Owenia fusiformis TaxID=6347 RepID=A0A8J1XUA5_OWEFU|nr:unnamed protein product [Owenia fusiformis]